METKEVEYYWQDAHIHEEDGVFVTHDEVGLELTRETSLDNARATLTIYASHLERDQHIH